MNVSLRLTVKEFLEGVRHSMETAHLTFDIIRVAGDEGAKAMEPESNIILAPSLCKAPSSPTSPGHPACGTRASMLEARSLKSSFFHS